MFVFSRLAPYRIRIVSRKKLYRRATRDHATGAIFGLEYLRKLKRNRELVFFCCSKSLFCTFWPKIIEICIVLSEIFSKNLYLDRFTWIFQWAGFFFGTKFKSSFISLAKLTKSKEKTAKNLYFDHFSWFLRWELTDGAGNIGPVGPGWAGPKMGGGAKVSEHLVISKFAVQVKLTDSLCVHAYDVHDF